MHGSDYLGLSDHYRNFAAYSSIRRHFYGVFTFGAHITANIDLSFLKLLHVYQGQELVIDLDFNEINAGSAIRNHDDMLCRRNLHLLRSLPAAVVNLEIDRMKDGDVAGDIGCLQFD